MNEIIPLSLDEKLQQNDIALNKEVIRLLWERSAKYQHRSLPPTTHVLRPHNYCNDALFSAP